MIVTLGGAHYRVERQGDRLLVQEVAVADARLTDHLRLPVAAWPALRDAIDKAIAEA